MMFINILVINVMVVFVSMTEIVLALEFLRACHAIQDMGAYNELHTTNSSSFVYKSIYYLNEKGFT